MNKFVGHQLQIETPEDCAAIAKGFSQRVYVEGGAEEGEFLIKPDTDLDDRFRAWAVDWQMWITITGCNCLIEEC